MGERGWLTDAGDNNLSFIETSALDASNVELAFQNILTGMISISCSVRRNSRLKITQKFTASSHKRPLTTATQVKTPSAQVTARFWR